MRNFFRLGVLVGSVAFAACGASNDKGSDGSGGESQAGGSESSASTGSYTGNANGSGGSKMNGSSSGVSVAGSNGSQTPGSSAGSSGAETGGSSNGGSSSSHSGAMSSASSSSTAGGGDAGSGTACRPQFASGVNVAWIKYASDVPSPNLSAFKTLFTNVYNAGGRVVRWWFHTDGSVTPGYTNGQATPISQSNINDVKSILDAAYDAGVAVNISLWAFDMLQNGTNIPTADNMNLLTVDADRTAYITNVLTPLVTALKGYHGLYSWEIFNEPEGMSCSPYPCVTNGLWKGWAANLIDEMYVQKSVNWFADAIHTADPNALVTNGAWTFIANSNVNGYSDFYSDSALLAAGGRSKGTLDFYQIHYYDNWGTPGGAEAVSPFQNNVSHWGLTDGKPVVVGEFWDIDTYASGTSTTIKATDLYTTLFSEGYAGAWAWQYANTDNPGPADYPNNSEQTTWGTTMMTAIQNLYTAHQSAVVCQ